MIRVTISDVAREAGVSLGTVSNTINHPERVRPETRRIINEAIDRLGYLPSQTARLLAGGVNAVVGLVLPRLNHGCSLQIANGARNEAKREGYDLIIMNTDDNEEDEQRYLHFCMGMQLAGVLVQPVTYHAPQSLQSLPVPLVYLSAPDVPAEALSVSADYEAQGRLIAEHVLACGATRIAVVGKASYPPLTQRLKGVRAVAAEHQEARFEIIDEGNRYGSSDGARIGAQLARRMPSARPDAIIGLADTIAAGVIAGVQAAGYIVPDDIMVAGCDGNPLAWSGSVSLTTCSPAGYEIGRKGVQLLVAQIRALRAVEQAAEEAAAEEKRAAKKKARKAAATEGPTAHADAETADQWDSWLYARDDAATGAVASSSMTVSGTSHRGASAPAAAGVASTGTAAAGTARQNDLARKRRQGPVLETTHELVKPFLLERASTIGEEAVRSMTLESLGTVPSTPELDLGSYL